MNEGLVNTKAGQLHYFEKGEGRPIVLIHTVGTSAQIFRDTVERLSGSYRAIAVDLPGHGDSDRMTSYLSIEGFADAVESFSAALSLDKPVYVGVSIGGPICTELAGRSSTGAVVVSECTALPPAAIEQMWPMVEKNFGIATQSREEVTMRFNEIDDELFWRWNIDRNKAGSWAMIQSMKALCNYDILAGAKQSVAPAMLLFGEKGPYTQHPGTDELAKILNADKIVLDNAGHFPMVDQPESFVSNVVEFVQGLAA